MLSELGAATGFNPNLETQSKLFDLLLARREELLIELRQLNTLIANYQKGAEKVESKSKPRLIPPKPPRVRGVLAAARKAVEQLADPFDKNQLLDKLVEIDEEFTRKRITGANIRNALRLLTQEGVIQITNEATATTCAKYTKTG